MSPDLKEDRQGRRRAEKRVVLTGASGFLGRAVVDRLIEAGWRIDAVTPYAVEKEDVRHDSLRWHQADLLDAEAAEGLLARLEVPCFMHLAWAQDRPIYSSPANFRWVTASMRLLEAFLKNGGERVVFAGSCAEYDWTHGVCRERDTPLAGGGAYGAAKRALFELSQGLCELYDSSENRTVSGAWARIFFLFGPYEAEGRLVAAVARSLIEGGPVRCSEGTQIRDYMFIGDTADALVTLLESEVSGPINVASGEGIRVRDLVLELADRVGGGSADRIEWGAVGPGAAEAPLVIGDIGRLANELGWQPPVGRSEGLDRTVAWWRERLAAKAEA